MKSFQIILGFLTTFVIIGGGAFGVVVGSGNELNAKSVWLSVLLGLVAAAKEVRAMVALPPLSNGNYEAIKQLVGDANKQRSDSDQLTLPTNKQINQIKTDP